MLEKPDIPEPLLISRLGTAFGLAAKQVTFLPLGADVNTAVYRVDTMEGAAYFLKLRKGAFDAMTVEIPLFLKDQGIGPVIAPLETRTHRHWARLGDYRMILSPYIQGQDGYQVRLADRQWRVFGAALKDMHTLRVPAALRRRIRREAFSPHFRRQVTAFQAQVEHTRYDDPTAAKLAAFMQAKRPEISYLVERAEILGAALQARPPEFVLCHGDIHPGNLLVAASGEVYVVDWDTVLMAPRERDLMFFGGGVESLWHSAREEEQFYRGYGSAEVDRSALAYYRFERIVEDIAAFCDELLLTDKGGDDREQSYRYFTSNFLPNGEIAVALATEKRSDLSNRDDTDKHG